MELHNFIAFEKDVITEIFKENPEYTAQLEAQYKVSTVTDRQFTGRGFFTTFEVPDKSFSLGEDVSYEGGNVSVLLNDTILTGYVLFVQNGFITCLEGYNYGEKPSWPDDIRSYKILQL